MKNNILLSIVIPTKNRQNYAYKAVMQILGIKDDRLQVIVQDNSENNDLKELLSELRNDTRLIFNHTSGLISFVDNFNYAVDLSQGEFVCVIGDDDGINPQILDYVDWMEREKIDIVKPSIKLGFDWPSGENNSKILKKSGVVSVKKPSGKRRLCNTNLGVAKLLKNGCQGYLDLDIAKIYHGIVRKECLEVIKRKNGKYFGGLSPDIYSAVSLSLEKFVMIDLDYPLTISGVCKSSASAASSGGRHIGKLEEAPHFAGHKEYNWEKEVPQFYSVETIWAETALKAVRESGKEELITRYFSKYELMIHCLIKHPEFKNEITDSYGNNFRLPLVRVKGYIQNIEIQIKRVEDWMRRKLQIDIVVYNVQDIVQASVVIEKQLNKSKYRKAFEKGLSPMGEN